MAVRTRRSIRTEEAYVTWGRPYILFDHKKHLLEDGYDNSDDPGVAGAL